MGERDGGWGRRRGRCMCVAWFWGGVRGFRILAEKKINQCAQSRRRLITLRLRPCSREFGGRGGAEGSEPPHPFPSPQPNPGPPLQPVLSSRCRDRGSVLVSLSIFFLTSSSCSLILKGCMISHILYRSLHYCCIFPPSLHSER